ncbi:hypothetical protein CKO28_09780 [Rhodovibrio sodomensis]|uniref:Helix-turn-helix domain-containing protein n=1 Tax=Rhodovibrio sodomensis TaxID=1088 RepID=A0ABS1DCY2_9PROT|nr:hypothetical protein [Rhodovibrio sodomensis]
MSEPKDEVLAEYFTKAQLAEFLGTSPRTLDRWERQRIGPPRIKVGKLILYRRQAVHDWLAAQESQPVRTHRRVA